jgi:hypothetical protein
MLRGNRQSPRRRVIHTAAEGTAPVTPWTLRFVAWGAYPALDDVRLSDYKVRILTVRMAPAQSCGY